MVTIADIQSAYRRIKDGIFVSPCVASQTFSRLTGNQIFFKLENLQMTGSFKERGALNKILSLTEAERLSGVVAASAGNHAQAVAYHATERGIRSQICMPLNTPLVKVTSTRNYGADVVLHGNNYDEAFGEAERRAAAGGLTLLHGFDDEHVIAGQGSVGIELLEQNPFLEAVVVPIGGGGLIAGIACAVKETNPKIRIVGVQTEGVPSMRRALEERQPVTVAPAKTIADGIAVRRVGARTLPLVEKYVDEIVTVSDEEIAYAILLLLEREKMLAEGAGAAGVAALLHHRTSLRNKRTAVLISGGNIDVTLLSRIIERGLVKDGRMVRVRVHLPDLPGGLNRLTQVIADQKANILETSHDRAYFGVTLGDTVVDVQMETRGPEHVAELLAALEAAGYVLERVR